MERRARLPAHRDWEQRECNTWIFCPIGSNCPRADNFEPVVTESIVVDPRRLRTPVLVIYYNRYLTNSDYAMFIKRVARRYSNQTLERLVSVGDHITRRAAVLSLSLMSDYSSNAVLGRALVDRDRGVRTIADSGIRELWCRIGSRHQQELLREISDLNDQRMHTQAARLATELIHSSPWIAEAWCQRGTAHYHLAQYDAAIRDCHQALEINPYHFTAAAGMGQCYMLQDNPVAALEAFRRALRLNPGLEEVRAQVVRLQRSLKKD
jgi:tetratricopeptide (TPR) repeat protein